MRLRDIVPPALERRIYALTGKDNPFEALTLLCSQGYAELAMLLLFYIAGAGEGGTAFAPYPMTMRLLGCETMVDERSQRMLVAVELGDTDGNERRVCIAIDDYTDENAYFVRPCTDEELGIIRGRTRG